MTKRHFTIFAEVCRQMSFSKAAEALNTTQPTVSLAIKELLISPALLEGAVSLIKEKLPADRYFVRTPALWDGLPGSYIQPFAMVKWLREDLRQAWGEERSGYFGLGFD